MYGWDFHPLLIHLSIQWSVLFLEQKESFIVLTKKISRSILWIYIEPPVRVAFYLLPNTEKLDLFRHKIIYCEGLFIQYISVHMYWLPYRSVLRPICVSTRSELLSTRAHLNQLFFLHQFYFSLKKTKTNYNFFFTSSRFFLLCCRVGWLEGNDCCPISTARS